MSLDKVYLLQPLRLHCPSQFSLNALGNGIEQEKELLLFPVLFLMLKIESQLHALWLELRFIGMFSLYWLVKLNGYMVLKEISLNGAGLIGLIIASLIVGCAVPTQTGLNMQLGKALGSPFLASLFSFCVGTFTVLCVVLINQPIWPTMSRLSEVPWWAWTGGLFGALFVTATILLAPRLGATTMVGLLVAGQMLASLCFDHYGFLGFPQHTLTWLRFLGVALVVAGVFLIQRF